VYDVRDYDSMFADDARSLAYLAAIERGVTRGSVVVEIGTGVGYFAVAACRAGARHVYAIETNPAIELAAQIASDNGCADRITFINADSRRVSLPEPGDALLSDLGGRLPLYGEHIATIVDARRRLLKPGATLMRRGDTLWAAPCIAPERWRHDHVLNGSTLHGIDRRAVLERVRSDWVSCRLERADLLAEGAQWASLDYATVESPHVAGTAQWTIASASVADGIAAWFDGDFGPGISLSSSPAAPRTLYGQLFFPFARTLALSPGDLLRVELRAHFVKDDYLWEWNSTLTPAGAGSEAVAFRQSNLAAQLVSLDRVRKLSEITSEDRRTSPTIQSTD
jgi:predicted RNA methylase